MNSVPGRAAHIMSQKFFHFGRLSTIAKPTGFALETAFCLTMIGPRRGKTFVTRKITRAVTAIKHGLQKELLLGNLDAKRIGNMSQSTLKAFGEFCSFGEEDDFVLAIGEAHTVVEFAEAAFSHANLDRKQYVKHDPRYERPAEVDRLIGDASKAEKILDWEPKVRFDELVRIMVDADTDLLSRKTPREHLGKLP